MAPALQERHILLDWAAFNFQDQDASPDADTARAVVLCWPWRSCSPVSCKKNKKAPLVCSLHGGQETQGYWSKQNADAYGVERGMWKGEAQADEEMGGITSSLPTRQPWVLLLCWIECNRTKFFSLTTGACELTSSLPWERNCHDKSQCLCLFFFFFFFHCPFPLLVSVSVSSCPHSCLVCAFSLFGSFILSSSLCVTHGDIVFPLSKC